MRLYLLWYSGPRVWRIRQSDLWENPFDAQDYIKYVLRKQTDRSKPKTGFQGCQRAAGPPRTAASTARAIMLESTMDTEMGARQRIPSCMNHGSTCLNLHRPESSCVNLRSLKPLSLKEGSEMNGFAWPF